ncbi:transglutaminase-like domain-containing protein [Dokdonella sp. MW10]|uniref:transglutaminase-like domain-containing protein n=1 Tax=Dokdonella sp. MW10 TaxID=2992926 RepID=UPI003F7DFE51
MRYEVGCSLSYIIEQPSVAVFNIRPSVTPQQWIEHESLELPTNAAVQLLTDPTNGTRWDRTILQPGPLRVEYRASVNLWPQEHDPALVRETPLQELPVDVLPYLLPSRYCEADRLATFARKTFGAFTGHTRVTAIANWIYDHIEYQGGTSTTHTTAVDTLADRQGVCRDFAHVGITFCRSLGIPARFVSVYALGLEPPDFHAVFEAYLDGQWYLFDPTRKADLAGFVRVATGRDAADAAFATFWNGRVVPEDMSVWIRPTKDVDIDRPRTVEAVTIGMV